MLLSRRLLVSICALAGAGLIASCTSTPPAQPTLGAVSSASPEATEAGLAILRAGGNAIDAAVAVQFALAVTEPAMSGLGGQTQIIAKRPGEAPFVINGTSFGPSYLPEGDIPSSAFATGWTSTTVPSTVKVMDFAMSRFGGGKVSWAQALAPAIGYAENGFEVGEFRAHVFARHADDLAGSPTAAPLFAPGGAAPKRGDILRQPVLAGTIRRLADAGGQDFYTGEIARQIASDMSAYGGWISAEDLAATPDPVVEAPLHARYRGYDVYTLPPPAGGWGVLVALNALQRTPQARISNLDHARARALLLALQEAHQARRDNSRLGPDEFAADILARIRAAPSGPQAEDASGETTHFSVVDADGFAVSVTTSIDSYFGAGVASPSLGFLYNNYMQSPDPEPGRAFSARPRAPPYSSMSASIVTRDGDIQLALGSPGSARIISAVAQVISYWIDVDADVEAAVAAARVHVVPRAERDDSAYVEQAPPGLDVTALGFTLVEPATDLIMNGRNAYFGGVHAIARQNDRWVGAADPRRDGAAGTQ